MSVKHQEEPKPAAPGYIVTFSDMITLLLTFFVMLLSMAKTQVEKHRFEVGIESFKRALADFGMSGLLNSQAKGLEFQHSKVYYRVETGQDEPENRAIDAKTEMLRRVLLDIERMMKISPSHITAKTKTAFPTNIAFAPASATLSSDAQKAIQKLAEQIRINYAHQTPIIYVLGLAADTPEPKAWEVSALRAAEVARYLKQQLSNEHSWPIFSWGAGHGGQWVGQQGLVSKQTHILINVLTESHSGF